MKRFRLSLRLVLILLAICGVLFALAAQRIQSIRRVRRDVDQLMDWRANVDVAEADAGWLGRFVPEFVGYPNYVRKYSDTPDLTDVPLFIELMRRNPTITNLVVEGSPLTEMAATSASII